MDPMTSEEGGDATGNTSETKSGGGISNKAKIFRADKIDLKTLDLQLERHMSRVWSRNLGNQNSQRSREVWEINPAKLEIRYVIAHGTFGTVYRGTYDGQDVAVKLLNWEDGTKTAAEATTTRESFKQEVSVWHKLSHPNVARFVGASMGTSELKVPAKDPSQGYESLPPRSCCVLVEFLTGGTLKKYLFNNRNRKLPLKVVVQLALDLSRGLSYLHSQRIVHRDVKADNLLLDPQKRLKIIDFGVARVEAQNPVEMTRETGTLSYMAPEVLDGKPYNRKCDVYSFGICLWEIYCCDLPYGPYVNLGFADMAKAVVGQNLRPVIPRCCPSSVASIMKRCWDAKPERRPEMDEVVGLLEKIDTSKGGGMIPEDQASRCFCFPPTRGP